MQVICQFVLDPFTCFIPALLSVSGNYIPQIPVPTGFWQVWPMGGTGKILGEENGGKVTVYVFFSCSSLAFNLTCGNDSIFLVILAPREKLLSQRSQVQQESPHLGTQNLVSQGWSSSLNCEKIPPSCPSNPWGSNGFLLFLISGSLHLTLPSFPSSMEPIAFIKSPLFEIPRVVSVFLP